MEEKPQDVSVRVCVCAKESACVNCESMPCVFKGGI